jgi:EAL domain-containing protein (putative c-di-GMP-specific phosphodiesterase class I)
VYQPIFTTDGEIVAFEALLRWQHPTWGPVNPPEFIPTAEKSGLIVPIGDWVIDEVCRQALEWNAAHLHPIKMFANVSGVQLERPDFSSKIANALKRSGLAPDRLELEITESWVISDLRGAAGKLQQLRDLGIGVALDDFGTGYAAFDYLQELPLDTLKIDRSFIQRLDGPLANLATVRAMTILARQLGLKTVAEGVESEEQVRQLGAIGCDFVQGFLLGRPLKPEAAGLLLRNQQRPAPLLHLAGTRASPVASTEYRIG